MKLLDLHNLRLSGRRPVGPVTVSLCGPLAIDPVVVLPEGDGFDFRWLVGLEIVVAHAGRPIPRIVRICDEILKAAPVLWLATWNLITHQVVNVFPEVRESALRWEYAND
jgi:hypothetical protein